MPTDSTDRVAAAYGPVLNIRAMRGREVDSITIEIPCEFHVQTTALLYGKAVIVTPIRLPTTVGYGIVHADMLADEEDDAEDGAPALAPLPTGAILAHVAVVRPAPSRGVTILTLELPLEFHVAATSLLFGRDVLVLPSNLPATTPLGPLPDALDAAGGERAPEPAAQPRATEPARQSGQTTNPSSAAPRRPALTRRDDSVVPAQWLGIHCAESKFQDWLQVHNEAQAIERVREMCEVASRRELATNPQARHLFLTLIYNPFRQHLRSQQLTRPQAPSPQSTAAPGGAFSRFLVKSRPQP
jgi:hypothetical protein